MTVPALLLIVGPTASGKSALAVELALRFGGEVVSADAMAVYSGMGVATAAPTMEERRGVPHHLIGCIDPRERCDVSRWLGLAEAAIAGIQKRGRLPIICGGTPLFTKAVLEGLSAGPPRDEAVRSRLLERARQEGPAALFGDLLRIDPVYAAGRHPNDLRRVVRALEVHALTGRPYSSFHVTDGVRRNDRRTLQVAPAWSREELHRRIAVRVDAIFAAGLVTEIAALPADLSREARQAVGCKEVLHHLAGHVDLAACRGQVLAGTRRLAKHQMTWYRRFEDIRWVPPADVLATSASWVAELLAP